MLYGLGVLSDNRMMEIKTRAPECRCGNGLMILKCAGKDAMHTGRVYYKCPADLKHDKSFLWCDDYHKNDPPGMIPDYVLNQAYKKHNSLSTSCSSSSRVNASGMASEARPTRLRSDVEIEIAFIFMAVVIFCLGIVIGKLF